MTLAQLLEAIMILRWEAEESEIPEDARQVAQLLSGVETQIDVVNKMDIFTFPDGSSASVEESGVQVL